MRQNAICTSCGGNRTSIFGFVKAALREKGQIPIRTLVYAASVARSYGTEYVCELSDMILGVIRAEEVVTLGSNGRDVRDPLCM